MNFFIFNEIVYKPIYNLIIFTYDVLPFADFGVAIIIVTILIKFLLIPISRKQIESQKKMNELQPKIKELQNKYKNDKQKQSQALMQLYKESKTNPFSGCLPLIIQLIFLIAFYRVLFNISDAGLVVDGSGLYPFVKNPETINPMFLGIIDLSSVINLVHITLKNIPHILLVVLAALSQYIQTKMMMQKNKNKISEKPQNDIAQIMSKQMLFLGPLLTLFIGFKFPAGLSLYWLVSTLFMIIQQHKIEKKAEPIVNKD
jgi:YidC/Oxa1 family membrane protein insertase